MNYRKRNSGFFSISNSRILLAVGTLITVFMSINLIKAIDENSRIQDRINKLNTNLEVLQEENKRYTDTLEYAETDIFIETEARDNLNMKKEGETVVSLPPEKVTAREEVEAEYQEIQERNQKANPAKWFDFFFQSADASER